MFPHELRVDTGRDAASIACKCSMHYFELEVGNAGSVDEWKRVLARRAGFFPYNTDTRNCRVLIMSAPWRETPGAA